MLFIKIKTQLILIWMSCGNKDSFKYFIVHRHKGNAFPVF